MELPIAPPAPQPAAARPPLVQLWRDPPGSNLRLELEGHEFNHAAELSPAQRAQVVEILRQWVAWLGVPPAKPAATPQPAKPAAPTPVPASTPLASTPIEASADKKPSFYRPRNMVEEVDAILAEMQSDLPPNATRIKLMGDMQHGIVAWIGLDHYDGIDNIPDEAARQLVRRAVAEWERRAG